MTILSGLWVIGKAALIIWLCLMFFVFVGSFALKLIKSSVAVIATIFGVNSEIGILSTDQKKQIKKGEECRAFKSPVAEKEKEESEKRSGLFVEVPRMR